ncbi:MAG: hypothetical protein NT004_06525 [Bacteroidetes bacterium]|nr:hypothetical protein [Bacteroidota bacterium]
MTEIGKQTEIEWLKTPTIRQDMNLELDAFVVMPNHFHAIIIIGENRFNSPPSPMPNVETPCMASLPPVNQFGRQSKNLASVMRGFKSAVTTYARKNNISFNWQLRFHDRIIRNEEAYQTIRNYIINNPKNWDNDKFRH